MRKPRLRELGKLAILTSSCQCSSIWGPKVGTWMKNIFTINKVKNWRLDAVIQLAYVGSVLYWFYLLRILSLGSCPPPLYVFGVFTRLSAPCGVGGKQALPQDHKESLPRAHTRETVVWQGGLFRWKLAPRFAVAHLCLSCCEKSPTLSSAKSMQKLVSSSCSTLKLSILEPTPSAAGPGSCSW